MSLKIRRGTNVERLTITPAEGELIYTTDTKNLYIGDGTTAGGKFVTGVGYSGSAGIGYTGSASVGYTGSAGLGYTGSAGSGIVSLGFENKLAYYPSTGTEINDLQSVEWNINTLTLSVDGKIHINGPRNGIEIVTEGTSNDDYSLFNIVASHNLSDESVISYARSRGDSVDRLSVIPGDSILGTYYVAYTSDSKIDLGLVASIGVFVDPNGNVSSGITPGLYTISTADDLGILNVNLSIDKDGLIGLANNTVVSGVGSGQVDDSSITTYLKVNVGGTDYAIPLYSIRP